MGVDLSVETKKPEELFLDCLPTSARRAFLYCVNKLDALIHLPWYLAGGTALALHIGHRQSLDLDFFLPKTSFDEVAFEGELVATEQWTTSFRQKGTIYGVLANTKVSFIAYPFFKPSPFRIRCGNVYILTVRDIAAMKIIAISQRGRKRDFVDLYWYCKNKEPLYNIILSATRQFPGQEDNINHILRSLVYFEDAEQDPMPKIFFDITWKEIKQYFQHEIPRITKEFLGLS